MTDQKEHFHGSDLEKIEQIYGIEKENIVSFSSNVNPLGISYQLKKELASHLDVITTYPERDYATLRKAIAEYVHTSFEHILVGNGSTELISLVTQLVKPKNALILGPTYSEYEHEISLDGGQFSYFRLREENDFLLDANALLEALTNDLDLLVICNPNNPTSTQINQRTMASILDTCQKHGIFVMIDETYVEFSERYHDVTAVPLTEIYSNVIVLRGISKFFAAPGLRLGYAVCSNKDLLEGINHFKKPWTINSLAAIAGEIMFQDTNYIQQTTHLISSERDRICSILDEHADVLKYYPPHANFILLRILKDDINSDMLFDAAIKKGLMIRNCASFPFLDNKYLRFCFMNPQDNDTLLEVLLQSLA